MTTTNAARVSGTPRPAGSAFRVWWKQLLCAANGHGGMRQVVAYIWECKKCGKRVNVH